MSGYGLTELPLKSKLLPLIQVRLVKTSVFFACGRSRYSTGVTPTIGRKDT